MKAALFASESYGAAASRACWAVKRKAAVRRSVQIAKSTLKLSKMLFTLRARARSEIIRTCGEIMGTFLDFLCFEMLCFRLLFGFGQLICARVLVGTDDAKCCSAAQDSCVVRIMPRSFAFRPMLAGNINRLQCE
jgi:hypothetical protein